MRIIVSLLAVALFLSGCSTKTTLGNAAEDTTTNNQQLRRVLSSEESLARAEAAFDRASEAVAIIEAAVLIAENEKERARAQATLRIAQAYLGTADRAVKRAHDSMMRARDSEQQRASAGLLRRGPYERQRDEARASVQKASDDAVTAAGRVEDIANALLSEINPPSDPVTPDPP